MVCIIFLAALLLVRLNISAALKTPIVEHEWTGLMRTLPDDRFETYTQALALLDSLQNSPSCHRLAASTLLESCQTVDDAPPRTEESLEDIKTTYAARLALCELSATGLAVPSECRVLLPADDREGKSVLKWIKGSGNAKSSVFRDVGNRQLSLCLRSLESRPQWWTSYSNSRQNAVIMCQAARVDIDRGEVEELLSSCPKTHTVLDNLIKLYKSMALAVSTMKDALSRALDNATSKLSQQEELAVKVKGFEQRVLKDLGSLFPQFQSSLAKLKDSTETVMQSMLGKWHTAAKHFSLELDELRNVSVLQPMIHSSNYPVSDLVSTQIVRISNNEAANLGQIFQQLRQRSSELLANQIQQRDSSREVTVELQALSRAVGDFHTAQNSQEAMQNFLHEQIHQMQTEVQMAREVIMEITSSASAVQVVLEKSSSQLATLGTLDSLASTISQFCWALLGIVALYRFSSTVAGYAAAALGRY